MEVSQAAHILQIGEFQLLQLAYLNWLDEPAPDLQLKQFFPDHGAQDCAGLPSLLDQPFGIICRQAKPYQWD
jgi:hypothetical protein